MPKTVRKASAVEVNDIGVYWNPECTNQVKSIDWGTLTPGSTKIESVYIRNEMYTQSCYVYIFARNWSSPKAFKYLSLSWNNGNEKAQYGEIVPTVLTLNVAPNIEGVTEFSFDIVIYGTESLAGDFNHDGIIDIYDLAICAGAYSSTPSSSNWIAEADLNRDRKVDIFDMTLMTTQYVQSAYSSIWV